jgi:hypothetical protein
VVDGERPLEFSIENLALYLYLTSTDILRAFHKNKFHCEFNPDPKKVADTVPPYFFYKVRIWRKS